MDIKYAITVIVSGILGMSAGYTIPAFLHGEAHVMQLIITVVLFAGWMIHLISNARKCLKEIKSLEEIKAELEKLMDVMSDFKKGHEEIKAAKTKKERIEALKRDLKRLKFHVNNTKGCNMVNDVEKLQILVHRIEKKVD